MVIHEDDLMKVVCQAGVSIYLLFLNEGLGCLRRVDFHEDGLS